MIRRKAAGVSKKMTYFCMGCGFQFECVGESVGELVCPRMGCHEKVEAVSNELVDNPRDKWKSLSERLAGALEFYAEKEDWNQFISSGNIFDEQDGDFISAFNRGEDSPWLTAKEALAEYEKHLEKMK